jgi:methyltransferase (TIGR00027 family)
MADEPLVRNISDTALWVAHYRAEETDRPDAVFRDPLARALAGERGERIARAQTFSQQHSWSFVARTVLFDRAITDEVRAGADLVVNLAAGLDARPYRMDLPRTLRWVEMDLPGILDYKERVIAAKRAQPVCHLRRMPVDLADATARREAFAEATAGATRAVFVSEGLLIYLTGEQVRSLSSDILRLPMVHAWIVDLASPGLVKMLTERGGDMIAAAGAPFRFGPPEGERFFEPLGWRPAAVGSMLKTARSLGRLSLFMRLIAMLPEQKQRPPERPWSGVVRLERA